jgi:hypothetical protein
LNSILGAGAESLTTKAASGAIDFTRNLGNGVLGLIGYKPKTTPQASQQSELRSEPLSTNLVKTGAAGVGIDIEGLEGREAQSVQQKLSYIDKTLSQFGTDNTTLSQRALLSGQQIDLLDARFKELSPGRFANNSLGQEARLTAERSELYPQQLAAAQRQTSLRRSELAGLQNRQARGERIDPAEIEHVQAAILKAAQDEAAIKQKPLDIAREILSIEQSRLSVIKGSYDLTTKSGLSAASAPVLDKFGEIIKNLVASGASPDEIRSAKSQRESFLAQTERGFDLEAETRRSGVDSTTLAGRSLLNQINRQQALSGVNVAQADISRADSVLKTARPGSDDYVLAQEIRDRATRDLGQRNVALNQSNLAIKQEPNNQQIAQSDYSTALRESASLVQQENVQRAGMIASLKSSESALQNFSSKANQQFANRDVSLVSLAKKIQDEGGNVFLPGVPAHIDDATVKDYELKSDVRNFELLSKQTGIYASANGGESAFGISEFGSKNSEFSLSIQAEEIALTKSIDDTKLNLDNLSDVFKKKAAEITSVILDRENALHGSKSSSKSGSGKSNDKDKSEDKDKSPDNDASGLPKAHVYSVSETVPPTSSLFDEPRFGGKGRRAQFEFGTPTPSLFDASQSDKLGSKDDSGSTAATSSNIGVFKQFSPLGLIRTSDGTLHYPPTGSLRDYAKQASDYRNRVGAAAGHLGLKSLQSTFFLHGAGVQGQIGNVNNSPDATFGSDLYSARGTDRTLNIRPGGNKPDRYLPIPYAPPHANAKTIKRATDFYAGFGDTARPTYPTLESQMKPIHKSSQAHRVDSSFSSGHQNEQVVSAIKDLHSTMSNRAGNDQIIQSMDRLTDSLDKVVMQLQ